MSNNILPPKDKSKNTIHQHLSCVDKVVEESLIQTVSKNIKKYAKKYSKIKDLNSMYKNKELSLNNKKNS